MFSPARLDPSCGRVGPGMPWRHIPVIGIPAGSLWLSGRRGRVVRQRPAKPCTPVRFRSSPSQRLTQAISSRSRISLSNTRQWARHPVDITMEDPADVLRVVHLVRPRPRVGVGRLHVDAVLELDEQRVDSAQRVAPQPDGRAAARVEHRAVRADRGRVVHLPGLRRHRRRQLRGEIARLHLAREAAGAPRPGGVVAVDLGVVDRRGVRLVPRNRSDLLERLGRAVVEHHTVAGWWITAVRRGAAIVSQP